MKFAQIAGNNDLTRKVVPVILSKSVLFTNYIEFFMKPGSAITVRKQGKSNDIAGKTRVLGTEYGETKFEPDYGTASRKFLGDQVKIDVALERMGYDLASEFESNLIRHMKDFPGLFHNMLINGDPTADAKQFAGLKAMVVANRKVAAGENGLELLQGNDNTAKKAQQAFLEKLDETIAMCEGNNKVLLMNARTQARLNSIARDYLTISKNEFGVPITFYNQIPLINPGDYQVDKDNYSPIIAFNETKGTAVEKCASVYCASFEEEDGVSFATCEGGFMVYDLTRVDTWWKSTYELIADSVLVRPSALSKLEGLYL
jgi:hypothetical protein